MRNAITSSLPNWRAVKITLAPGSTSRWITAMHANCVVSASCPDGLRHNTSSLGGVCTAHGFGHPIGLPRAAAAKLHVGEEVAYVALRIFGMSV